MERVSFMAGDVGEWQIDRVISVIGEPLPGATRLRRVEADTFSSPDGGWSLHGVRSHDRYVTRPEKTMLGAVQEGLGRSTSTLAALIPIRKSAAWWAMTQDERRAIFEEQSKHMAIGYDYLPAIARRLYHCRARACGTVRRARRAAPRDNGVGLRGARGRASPVTFMK